MAAHEAGRHHDNTSTGYPSSQGTSGIGSQLGSQTQQSSGGYAHFTHGPHITDTANRLDPHVPGEYPLEGGQDRHSHTHAGRDTALAGAAGVGAHEATRHHDRGLGNTSSGLPSTSTGTSGLGNDPSLGQSQHHYGRDAALAGGAGAAGLGAHDLAHRDRHTGTSGTTGTTGTHSLGSTFDEQRAEPPHAHEHHYGRDAAAVGGAGALGAGAYEAERHHHGQTGTHIGSDHCWSSQQ